MTLTAVGGIVRADAAVKFIDKHLQGWERSDRLSLSKSDYRAEDFPYFDVPVRDAGAKPQDASSVRHNDDERGTKIAGGHWPIKEGEGSTMRIPLVAPDTISAATVDYTVTQEGRPRVTFRLGGDGRIVEVVLLNVPPTFISNPPRGEWPDQSLVAGPNGSAMLAFFAPEELESATQERAYFIRVARGPDDAQGLGHVTYDSSHMPIAVFIYQADERLPLALL